LPVAELTPLAEKLLDVPQALVHTALDLELPNCVLQAGSSPACFFRRNRCWRQFTLQGPKLVGTGAVGAALEGNSVALPADGSTAIVSGFEDNNSVGAARVFIQIERGEL
jgi:hypothetical protein